MAAVIVLLQLYEFRICTDMYECTDVLYKGVL